MFKRHPKEISHLASDFMSQYSLTTPLLQYRLVKAWETVAGPVVARYTVEKSIRNQTLWVKISAPALRQDLMMQCTELTRKLNDHVGSRVITGIRIY